MMRKVWLATGLLGVGVGVFGGTTDSGIQSDTQLRAMTDELGRSTTLQLNNLDKPYFIAFTSEDTRQVSISASLGGLLHSNFSRVRVQRAAVRVGSYASDNTNSIYTRPQSAALMSLDDDYSAIRNTLWLASDSLYKVATAELTGKRTALREVASPDATPDFAKAPPVHLLTPVAELHLDQSKWEAEVQRISARFTAYPSLASSAAHLVAASSTLRLVNTEGTVVRVPQELASFELRGAALASDGAHVWNQIFITVTKPSELPEEAELSQLADELGRQVDALAKAPLLDDYTGPVLFEGEAAAQLVAELMAETPRLSRRPVAPTGANVPTPLDSVWATRLGSKVAPEWLSITDDPSQKVFGGKVLAGSYSVDDEGVSAAKVKLVENGVLRNFLLTRQPVRSYAASNGHARLPGLYGSEAAVPGNIFVQVAQPVPRNQMKAKLLDRVKEAGVPFGILIRRLDFPATADIQDLTDMAHEMQKEGYARTVSPPLLAYRVYPDGREELVRGVRFREFSAKNLRDLTIASDAPYVLNYVNYGSTFNFARGASDETTSSVVCPSLLIDGVELTHGQGESSRPPVVPPPTLVAGK